MRARELAMAFTSVGGVPGGKDTEQRSPILRHVKVIKVTKGRWNGKLRGRHRAQQQSACQDDLIGQA